MRITVAHREERYGFLGARRRYYVDCEVLFSEEEKAIIRERDLFRHHLTVDPPVPPPVAWHSGAAKVMRAVAPYFLMAACGGGLAVGTPLGMPLLLISGALFFGSFFLVRKNEIAELKTQPIPLQQLLDAPCFTLYALDPARAKAMDDTLREKLARLKRLLLDSIALREAETFEL